jgi:ABC-type nitrate/sulfonate/bicarbonate transport system substrate-binding protein
MAGKNALIKQGIVSHMRREKGRKKKMKNIRHSKKKFVNLLLAALLLLTATLSGCGGGGASDNEAAGGEESATEADAGEASLPDIIKLQGIGGAPNNTESATIGIEKGFFDEQNIEIENVGVISVAQWVSSLVSGTVDACLIMTSEGLAAIDNGAEIIAVASGSDTYEDNTHMTFLVPKGSPIKTGQDFVGKKLASPAANGGCTGGFPLEFMRQAGVEDPINSIDLITVPEESLVETLRQGGADIVGSHLVPRVVNLLYGDEVDIVFTDYDILENKGGDMDWYMRKDYVEQNPELVKRFVTAIAKTNNFINENPEEAGEVYKAASDNINEELFNVRHYAPDAIIREDHTQVWIDLLGNPGQVQLFKNNLTFDQVATNEFNPNI